MSRIISADANVMRFDWPYGIETVEDAARFLDAIEVSFSKVDEGFYHVPEWGEHDILTETKFLHFARWHFQREMTDQAYVRGRCKEVWHVIFRLKDLPIPLCWLMYPLIRYLKQRDRDLVRLHEYNFPWLH